MTERNVILACPSNFPEGSRRPVLRLARQSCLGLANIVPQQGQSGSPGENIQQNNPAYSDIGATRIRI